MQCKWHDQSIDGLYISAWQARFIKLVQANSTSIDISIKWHKWSPQRFCGQLRWAVFIAPVLVGQYNKSHRMRPQSIDGSGPPIPHHDLRTRKCHESKDSFVMHQSYPITIQCITMPDMALSTTFHPGMTMAYCLLAVPIVFNFSLEQMNG